MAQGAKGRSRQADPSGQSTNQTKSEHVKGTGGRSQLNGVRPLDRGRDLRRPRSLPAATRWSHLNESDNELCFGVQLHGLEEGRSS